MKWWLWLIVILVVVLVLIAATATLRRRRIASPQHTRHRRADAPATGPSGAAAAWDEPGQPTSWMVEDIGSKGHPDPADTQGWRTRLDRRTGAGADANIGVTPEPSPAAGPPISSDEAPARHTDIPTEGTGSASAQNPSGGATGETREPEPGTDRDGPGQRP